MFDTEPLVDNYIFVFSAGALARLVLYVSAALPVFAFLWLWKGNPLRRFKINDRFPGLNQYWFEFRSSLSTILIWSALALGIVWLVSGEHTRMYRDIGEYGWWYWLATNVAFILIHDTYFYFLHRAMHDDRLFLHFHAGHHRSVNPTPLAIFSFQPLEAVLQFAVIFIYLFAFPTHLSVYVIWTIWMIGFNVLGHLGYELFPRGFTRHCLTSWMNTTTHHAMHHRYVSSNFGLYFTFWDRVMGTEHPSYHEMHDRISAGLEP